MSVLVQIAQFLLSLSILVFLHEMGHFVFARLFKTRVEKFYIFFNPWFALFKRKIGETEYGIGWLPLGGYVKISGMMDESMDREQMKKPPQPWEFRSKPTIQRLLIMIGGVLVNFVLALVIYTFILFLWGEQYLPTKNVKYGIVCDSVALDMGLRNGDRILTIDNRPVERFNMIFHDLVVDGAGSIQVERDGRQVNIPVNEDYLAPLLKSSLFISTRVPFVVDEFSKDSPAKKAGMMPGDRIIGVDEERFDFYDEYHAAIAGKKGQPVNISVLRGDEERVFTLTTTEEGLIGVWPVSRLDAFFEMEKIEYSFLQAIPAGISRGFNRAGSYLKQLRLIFKPKTKAYESLGGFIKIGSFFPETWDWQMFWEMTALLSIILAIMNLLPIPALDGGHVMFLSYEMISGRKPGEKFMEYAQIAGMLLLLALLLYANGNDVVQLFRR